MTDDMGTAGADAGFPVLPSRFRVGMDLCSVDSVAESIERFGQRYLTRIYTDEELHYSMCRRSGSAERLAARFAAKEATIKVLRPRDWWPDWRSIEIRTDPGGWCEVYLTGPSAKLAEEARVVSLEVSLSHDGGVASAVVIGELAL